MKYCTKEMKEILKAEINTSKIYISAVKNVSTIDDVYQHLNSLKIFIQMMDPSF